MTRHLAVALFVSLACACGSSGSGSTTTGPRQPVCTSTYQGPSTSTELGGTCESIWESRCLNGGSAIADENCEYALSAQDANQCPYCASRDTSVPVVDDTPQSNTACQYYTGAFGCIEETPYTCLGGSSCYATYQDCVDSAECDVN